MSTYTPKFTDPVHVAALIEARKQLCTIRDALPLWHQTSVEINKIVAEIEELLGY